MENVTNRPETAASAASSRRSFLRVAGAAAVTGGLLSACSNADQTQVTPTGSARAAGDTVTLPAGDPGILAFAYVLEQLEAAFYARVMATPYTGMSMGEMSILSDIRYHEAIHRDLFKAALKGAISDNLTFNFTSVDFTSRASVLQTAADLEMTGVGAYNGAGKYIKTDAYLLLAGKIVSVEARHNSIIRELQYPNLAAFAAEPLVNSANGLHLAYEPGVVLPIAQKFIYETINASTLAASLS